MKQGIWWRVTLVAGIFCVAAAYLIPGIVFYSAPGESEVKNHPWVEKYLPDGRINLGLDLMGGTQLTLEVEVDKALKNHLIQVGQDLADRATKKGLLMAKPRLLPTEQLEFVLMVPEKRKEFEAFLDKEFPSLLVAEPISVGSGNLQYTALLKEADKKELEEAALDQALGTIRNRIDQFGVAEPDVRKQEGNRITIQLPGVENADNAVSILDQTAHLEFRIVRDGVNTKGIPPSGVEFLPMLLRSEKGNSPGLLIAVEKTVSMTGESITNAQPRPNQEKAGYLVSISFDRRGKEAFSRLTGENIGRQLAIVLDGKVYSAPRIETQIFGDAVITGDFDASEANSLAIVLRSGSLPAPVKRLATHTVGPSLGKASIDMGVTAAVVACAIIFVFMFVYYGWSGLIADLMLLLDVVLILAGLAFFGATLTLPGIAGIVLALGMAIDANVLIFERIREEIKAGQSVKDAVDQGFAHAQRAIVDSNLTSIIATVILYELGSGPIRGFAVTLTLGIIASMFTAVFVSRIIFDFWVAKPGRKLSI